MKTKKCFFLLAGQYIFIAIGVLSLAYWEMETERARRFQAREAHLFNGKPEAKRPSKDPRRPASLGSPWTGEEPIEGSVVARLTISDLSLGLIVVEGVSERDLSIGPGHIPGTSLPGETGNVGIAGHRDTFFRPLRFIRKGEIITLGTVSNVTRYQVVSTAVVGPKDTRVLYATTRDTLTLVTCYPFDFVGPAPKRFIVRAERVG